MTTKIAGGDELQQNILSPEAIAEYIESHSKPRGSRMFGVEYERLGVWKDTCKAIPFDNGVEKILSLTAERFGWEPGYENGHIVYLSRGKEAITLEPGGQTEYSSAPAEKISELMCAARKAMSELDEIANEMNIIFLGIGYHPFSNIDDIQLVPKTRYNFMKPYLSSKGKYALEMMFMTAGCQVALDYEDAFDLMRKLRAASLATPIAQALFASSGIGNGKILDVLDHRARIWRHTDNARCNIPDFMLKPNSDIMEYVNWLIDMPLMFLERNSVFQQADGITLRQMIKDGKALYYDLELAMTQAFPEVRVKRFIEIRSVDAPQPYLLPSVPCFWSSLIYGKLDDVFELLGKLTYEEFNEMRDTAIKSGLKGIACGRKISDWAKDLVSIVKETCICEHSLSLLRERAESEDTPAEIARKLIDNGITPSEFAACWNDYGREGKNLRCR